MALDAVARQVRAAIGVAGRRPPRRRRSRPRSRGCRSWPDRAGRTSASARSAPHRRRARTSAMMARTASRRPREVSRLVARNAANAPSKSGSLALRAGAAWAVSAPREGAARFYLSCVGDLSSSGCLRLRLRAATRPQILQLGLDALDLQPDRAAVGEMQDDVARPGPPARARLEAIASRASTSSFGRGRCHCTLAASTRSKRSAARRRDVLGRPAAVAQGVSPVEAVGQGSEALLPADRRGRRPQHGILQVRRDHREVLGIQCDQLQLGHRRVASLEERARESEAVASLQHICCSS